MAADFDLKPHTAMWRDFTRLMTLGACAVVLGLALMALFLLT